MLIADNNYLNDDCLKRRYYVAMTRAKTRLLIHTNGNYFEGLTVDRRFVALARQALESSLYGDPYVKNRKGIFEFLLGGESDTKLLDIRVFDDATKKSTYARQTELAKKQDSSNCPYCAIGHDANAKKICNYF